MNKNVVSVYRNVPNDTVYFSIDTSMGKEITVEDRFMNPTPNYPFGSWIHLVNGDVHIATGEYAKKHPGKPSPYPDDRPPFVVLRTGGRQWPWEKHK